MPPAWLQRPGDVAPAHRRAPDEVYDDADALRHWTRLAIEAGARAPAKRKPRRRS